MELRLTIPKQQLDDLFPDRKTIAQAAGEAVADLVKRHFEERNSSRMGESGMPKSNYWDEARQATRIEMNGDTAVITVDKEGAALHYFGGTVYPGPGKKALAIPKHPATAGMRAREYAGEMFVVWKRGETSGMLVSSEPETAGELMYLLIPKATLAPDPSVLPTESEMIGEAVKEIEFQRSIWS